MKIQVILFLVISFCSNSLSVNKEDTLLKVSSLEEVKSISKDCPFLLKFIEDNNIENYTINCRFSEGNVKKITEEVVLQQACSLVHNMLLYICKNRFQITNATLRLDGDKKMSICPFKFVHFTQPNNLNFTNIEKKLTDEKDCNKVCYDFDEPRMQCLVLDRINKYIKNLDLLKYSSVKKPEVPSEPIKTEVNSSTNILNTDVKSESEKFIDGTWIEKNNITKVGVEETGSTQITPVIKGETHSDNQIVNDGHKLPEDTQKRKEESNNHPSTEAEQKFTLSTKLITPKSETNPSNLQTDDSVFKNEDALKENDEGEEDHEEMIDKDLQKLDAFDIENKLDPKETSLGDSPAQSKIYPGERFFQAEDSHFFFYFLMCSSIVIIGYLAFHNKKKIIAFALEGRNGRRIRRRPNPARYRKLESNLEEVIASNDSHTSASSVVY